MILDANVDVCPLSNEVSMFVTFWSILFVWYIGESPNAVVPAFVVVVIIVVDVLMVVGIGFADAVVVENTIFILDGVSAGCVGTVVLIVVVVFGVLDAFFSTSSSPLVAIGKKDIV